MSKYTQNGGLIGKSNFYWDGDNHGTHTQQSVYDSFSSSPHNREGYNKGAGGPGLNPMLLNDQVVFGSCLMQGPCGPSEVMINTWNSSMPVGLQPYLSVPSGTAGMGIQRWTVPGNGTYRFKLAGAFATHDSWQGRNSTNSSSGIYNTNLTVGGGTGTAGAGGSLLTLGSGSSITGTAARGKPGLLTVDFALVANQVVDIMVGQRGHSCIQSGAFGVAASAGGASAIFIDGWSAWDGTTSGWTGAIAGGGASNRNPGSQGGGTVTSYGTTGGNGDGGNGGTNGAGGTDNSTGNYDSTSGAGLVGNGSLHTDQRSASGQPAFGINGRTAKAFNDSTRPGQGNMSGAYYVNPYHATNTSYNQPNFFIYIDASGNVATVGTADWQQFGTTEQTALNNYATGATNTITNVKIPLNCIMGGFGGAGVGNFGGSAGSGGYSGGGAGANSNSSGGGGSSYQVGGTFVSHSTPEKTSAYNEYLTNDNLIWGGVNYGKQEKGALMGNGEVVITRIA